MASEGERPLLLPCGRALCAALSASVCAGTHVLSLGLPSSLPHKPAEAGSAAPRGRRPLTTRRCSELGPGAFGLHFSAEGREFGVGLDSSHSSNWCPSRYMSVSVFSYFILWEILA